ncbi:redoxin domain-containing protein [Rhodanobacter terrae]|uniref:Redoxin domain-containing protein n=1 Tax=Rhodanobacter terrae TaxID=418647 RepID=A0ABW0SVD0_9GAMM
MTKSKTGFLTSISKMTVLLLMVGLSISNRDAGAVTTAPAKPHVGATESRYRIDSQISGLKDGIEVKLFLTDGSPEKNGKREPAATTISAHGTFSLKGRVDQPVMGSLWIGPDNYIPMIIEPARYTIKGSGDHIIAVGGRYNDVVYGYTRLPKYIVAARRAEEREKLANTGLDESNEAAVKASNKAIDEAWVPVRKIKNGYQRQLLEGNAAVLVKLFTLADNDDPSYSMTQRMAMLDTYAEKVGPRPQIARMRRELALSQKLALARRALAIGKPYKDIVARDAEGNLRQLSDVLAHNKLVLVNFWASWCGPCRAEFPRLAKLYRQFHGRGFEIYAVSLDEDRAQWLKALKDEKTKIGVSWVNLRDDQGVAGMSASTYGIRGLPGNILIAGGGVIVGHDLYDWDIDHAVRAQMKKIVIVRKGT